MAIDVKVLKRHTLDHIKKIIFTIYGQIVLNLYGREYGNVGDWNP